MKTIRIEIVTDTDIISGEFTMPVYYDETTLTAEDIRTDSNIQPA
jgi:hypothetical protein